MKTKTRTKQQREDEAKAALRQRVADIIRGATGGEDPEAEDFWLTLEAASRAIPALKAVFGTDDLDYLWRPHCLNYFESLDSTVKHLWTSGVRA